MDGWNGWNGWNGWMEWMEWIEWIKNKNIMWINYDQLPHAH